MKIVKWIIKRLNYLCIRRLIVYTEDMKKIQNEPITTELPNPYPITTAIGEKDIIKKRKKIQLRSKKIFQWQKMPCGYRWF